VLFSTIVQLPLFLQLALGASQSLSGLMLVPLTLGQVAISTATGIHISSTGRPRGPMTAGLVVTACGLGLMSATLGLGLSAICMSSILFGLGLGTTMPAAQTLAQWAAGPERLGAVTATLSFARSIGGAIGAALTSALLLIVLRALAPEVAASAQALMSSSTGHAPPPLDPVGVRTAFRWVFGAMAMLALAAAAVARSLPNVDLSAPSPGGDRTP
jgi:hypothetical protein